MSETKFTPGPWWAERLGQTIEIGAKTPLGHLSVAWVHLGAAPTPMEVSDGLADARLIAAAPDLYEALDALISRLGPDGYIPHAGEPLTNRARAALAKARGDTP